MRSMISSPHFGELSGGLVLCVSIYLKDSCRYMSLCWELYCISKRRTSVLMAMRDAVVSANFKFLTLSGFCRSPVLVREERLKWYK
jgi:hypothetical protein